MELPPGIDIHPRALREAALAHEWYAVRGEQAGARFLDALYQAALKVAESPQNWPSYSRRTRFVKLRRFPYLLVYEASDDSVLVVAVAHVRRRPRYWRRRLK
jgi:plasmid stabilization system protein ParE